MLVRAWLVCLILAVPAIGVVTSTMMRSWYESEFQIAAARRRPRLAPDITLDAICRSGQPFEDFDCVTYTSLGLMRTTSIGAGVAGVSLLVLLIAGAIAARSSRLVLLRIFRPGLYVTATVLTGLILIHAVIAIATLYFVETAILNRVHLGVVALIALGAMAGVAAVARSAFSVVQKAHTFAVGRTVSRAEAPRLWEETESIATRLGALQPDSILIGLDPTFFVTEANVASLSGGLTGRTLFCSLPLARILTTAELSAIIGHELGHFRGEDTQYSERFYPIYRGATTAIASLNAAGGQGWGSVALLPAIAVFNFFLECFAGAERRHGRARELLADEAGAAVTDRRTMATALVKVHAFAGDWASIHPALIEAIKSEALLDNVSAKYAEAVVSHAGPKKLEGIADTHTSHPTDSHPTLAERLSALNIELASVAREALAVAPLESAAALIPDSEQHEQALSAVYQQLLGRQLGIEPRSAKDVSRAPGIKRCPSCGSRVLPKAEGVCPACGTQMT